MVINPVTGLEEDKKIEEFETPEIKADTPDISQFSDSPSPVTLDDAGNLSTWFTPLKFDTKETNITADTTGATDTKDITGTDTKDIVDTTKTTDLTDTTVGTKWVTGIEEVDTELDKLKIEKEKKIKETQDQFNIERWVYEERKDNYTNFDEVNEKANNVLEDIRNAQAETGTDLTDEQYQQIALKNWVSVEEVKSPRTIFWQLEFTEEGKKDTGISSAESQLEKYKTNFERTKEDLAFQLEGQLESINNQIDDTRRQLAENVAWATAAGAWSGGLKSSGYERGIQNIKDEWERVISRLQEAKDRLNSANETNIKRLTDDYELASKEAKETLDKQIEGIKFDTGLQLNGLEGKYWLWTTELTNALNDIQEEFGTKSLQVFDDYLSNMQKINQIANSNIEQQEKLNNLIESKMDKRYNELIDNNGLLLSNTSLTNLTNSLNRWELTPERYDDLKNIMLSSINQTLAKKGTVDESNLTTIASLLDNGLTPAQVIAKMSELEKFQETKERKLQETVELESWEKVLVYDDGTREVISAESIKQEKEEANLTDFLKWAEWFRSQAYDDATGKTLAPWETPVGTATIGYWFTTLNWKPVTAWMTITQEEADSEFAKQVKTYQNFKDLITVPLTEAQETALTSFEYNLGRNIWNQSGADIIKAINNNDFEEAGRIMKLYNQAGWEFNQWLQNRRNKEAGLLMKVSTETEWAVIWPLWVPVAFERQIKQMVPTQLQNSEVELAALNDTIKRMHEAGFSTDEAVLTYMWFDIQNDSQRDKALKFVDIARTLWTDIQEDFIPKISNFINNWEDKKAMDLTERVAKNAMTKELWSDYIPENVARNWIERSQELLDLINILEETWQEPLGEFEGTFKQWIGRFKGKDAQQVATQAERLVAQFRTDLIGTAGSQTENNNIVNLIPSLWDDIENFRIKVSDIWDESLRELNNQREEYWLPQLTIESIKDKDKRLKLYTDKLYEPEELVQMWQEKALSQMEIAQQVLLEMKKQKETNEFNSLY